MNKLNVIWCLTSFANVVLGLLLLFRGYYVRYSWIFFSCVFSVIVDMFGYFALVHDSAHYMAFFRAVYFVCLGLNGMIIWEAFCLRDQRVHIPIEFYLGLQLVAFLAEYGQFPMTAYYVECGTRIVNLLMILWFISIFRKEPISYA